MDKVIEFPRAKPNENSGRNSGEKPLSVNSSEGQVVNFDKILQVKRLLESSPVKPTGGAYSEKFQHADNKRFTVISLIEHFSSDAIKEVDRQLETEKPDHLIIEGIGNQTPEAQYAHKQAEKLAIPATDIIIPPYNAVVAGLAGVKIPEVLSAIIAKELPRYEEHLEILVSHLSRTFNLSPIAINVAIVNILQRIQTDRNAFIANSTKDFDKLVACSNDLSWHKLQKLNIQGNVLAIAVPLHSNP